MSDIENILERLLERLNKFGNDILLIAQSSLSRSQFVAFRKYFLDKLNDLIRTIKKERNGQALR